MTDPTAQEELPPPPPAKPPRPSYNPATQKQLHDDEMYARQLAEHFNGGPRSSRSSRPGWNNPTDEYPEERERNFFDGLSKTMTLYTYTIAFAY